jgi:hypothetical protein
MSEGNPADNLRFIPGTDGGSAQAAGVRTGASGTHTSRTIMLAELSAVFDVVPAHAQRGGYAHSIIEENSLHKPTAATRKITNQRLAELYTLDVSVPVFRVLRRLWEADRTAHPLLALLVSLARDPLLRVTASVIIPLPTGSELPRDQMRSALHTIAGDRLKEAVIEKVMRNAASSWTQSGHLEGRTFKIRRAVRATPVALALALYIAYKLGFRGEDLFTSGWVKVLDCSSPLAKRLATEASRLGLIDLRTSSDFIELNVDRLDAPYGRTAHGTR